jgi:hypothetical protein
MRTIITLSSLGLTLALSGAGLATPANRSVLGLSKEQLQNYYIHKRYYRHEQDRACGEGLLQDRGGVGAAATPLARAVSAWAAPGGEPVVRECPL